MTNSVWKNWKDSWNGVLRNGQESARQRGEKGYSSTCMAVAVRDRTTWKARNVAGGT